MAQRSGSGGVLLIKGGRVYDHDGNTDLPTVADVLIVDGLIANVGTAVGTQAETDLGGRKIDEIIDATDKLVIPGFVNAHYHSHDVLLKGCFETIPLELWLLSALPPSYPKRTTAEIRARTLLGAVECLRSGITTVQDLATLHPFDDAHVDAILEAYEDVGIRCVFALQVADIPGVKLVPFWDEIVPEHERGLLSGAAEPLNGIDIPSLIRDVVARRRGRHSRITWALGPSSPGSCTERLLTELADFSRSADLPIYTHVYESKAMTLSARRHHAADDGSLVKYLKRLGLLSPRLNLAHSIWITHPEIETLAAEGVNVVLNPMSNLKNSGRRRSDPVLLEGWRQCRAGMRQLQLQRCPKHVPVHENVCGSRRVMRSETRPSFRCGCNSRGDRRGSADGWAGREAWSHSAGHGGGSLDHRFE